MLDTLQDQGTAFTSEHDQASVDATHALNPGLSDALAMPDPTNLDPPAQGLVVTHGAAGAIPQPPESHPVLDAWDSIKKVGDGLARGVVEGRDAMMDKLGSALSSKTGQMMTDATLGSGARKLFMSWYGQKAADGSSPLQTGPALTDKMFGPAQGGVAGFVENAAQFATGMAAVSAVAPEAELPAAGKILYGAVKGAAADLTVFSPQMQRLSNLIQSGPSWMQNPVTAFLAAKPGDSQALARFKQGAEGLLMGSTIESMMHGFSALKAVAKGGAGATEVAATSLKAAQEAAVTPLPGDVAKVAPIPGTDTYGVVHVDHAAELPAEHTPAFQTAGEAESVAASFNYVAKNETLETGTLDDATVKAVQAGMADYAKNGDMRSAADIMDAYGFNMRYIQSPEDVQNTVKALVDHMPDPSTMTRNRPTTWAETAAQSDDIFRDMSGAQVLQRMSQIYGESEKNPSQALAMRVWMQKHTDMTFQLSKMADANPDNPVATQQLGEALNTMLEAHAWVSGNASNAGRTLNILKAPVGGDELTAAVEKSGQGAPAAITPEHTEAQGAIDQAKQEIEKAKAEPKPNQTDTYAVSASDFSLARAAKRLQSATNKLNNGAPSSFHDEGTTALHTEHLIALSDMQRGLPLQLSPEDAAKVQAIKSGTTNPIDILSRMIDGAQTDLDKSMEKARTAKSGKQLGPNPDTNPIGTFMKGQDAANIFKNNTLPPMSAEQLRGLARSIFLTGNDDPGKILSLIRGPVVDPGMVNSPESSLASFAQTYRMNAMLSGPKTQLTKVASDAITAFQRPMEYWWSGATNNNPALRTMGSDMMGGMMDGIRESWTAAKMAFQQGDNVLAPSNSHTGTTLGALGDNSFLQNVLTLPSRMLMTTDEFAKQMNYRANVRAQILRQARSDGVTDATALASRLQDQMQFQFDPKGGAVNPLGLQYAKENTYTQSLRPGSIQQNLLDMVNAHPTLKVIMLFVRTPMNIFNATWERTPVLNRLNQDFAEQLSGKLGQDAQDLAKGKSSMGIALWTSGAALVASGRATGRGPTDPELRKQWLAAGNQPYSIKVPGSDNEWISYRRANPVLSHLGLIADAIQMSGDLKQADFYTTATAVLSSITANLSSKTFMQGATEFTDAMASGKPASFKNFIQGAAGSMIPNVLNQANPDDTARETHGLIDELAARVPGFSQNLEPRRNILGEKILRPPGYFNDAVNPFTLAPGATGGDVQEQLVQLGKGMSMPAEKRNGLDLTDRSYGTGERLNQSPYDRMLELMGNPTNGPSLRSQLGSLMGSPGWQKAPDNDTGGPGGMKWQLASDIIHGAQERSWAQVLQEYPKLRTAYTQSIQASAQGKAQGAPPAEGIISQYARLFGLKK